MLQDSAVGIASEGRRLVKRDPALALWTWVCIIAIVVVVVLLALIVVEVVVYRISGTRVFYHTLLSPYPTGLLITLAIMLALLSAYNIRFYRWLECKRQAAAHGQRVLADVQPEQSSDDIHLPITIVHPFDWSPLLIIIGFLLFMEVNALALLFFVPLFDKEFATLIGTALFLVALLAALVYAQNGTGTRVIAIEEGITVQKMGLVRTQHSIDWSAVRLFAIDDTTNSSRIAVPILFEVASDSEVIRLP